ncbi:adenosylcobalamin-dependent ribonucleoside-diphosphate reductase [Aquicella lusitana]|uniref:Vitamin B12-dependent ribonucleotide reductase n=1 Tax=Aquicella lusitana TaxID=254246 RepID=A0A370G7W2_9COXI|nr:adenosylcobalamin-dependent ribonucleoside-diphosphate reductase [Aquicella lusitana]RDI39196.1 ribonucleoside-diphosphate reductase class II [Aquicella lusitana]VVC74055.1 Vitamin B12-dependent ribonucleoside-diphosphate reductase [Aquicella lusitana]
MNTFKEPISNNVWDLKYRYRFQGHIIDQTIEDTWRRVAVAVAGAEKTQDEQAYWQKAFYRLLEDFQFLPGGRILAGAGTEHAVTLFNCFVMDIAEDSLKGIFDALREGALTLQQGGGVGYDFSVLRPKGALVKKTGTTSSGPVSFMRIWDTTCKILLATGARRGAMMAVLRCDHPDIEEFISAKEDPLELRHFNVSVMVTDAFMEAVRDDADWPLVFPTKESSKNPQDIVYRQWGSAFKPVPCRIYRHVKARELWHKIIRSAYQYAEPGVLFGDTINRMNTLWYRERINATNPCGEIPLPPYGACNLGSINLTQFVEAPFSPSAKLNWIAIEETIRVATRFQDNVIDISHYPLPVQREQATGTRRIGIGVTGLADAFVMLGVRYGSPASIELAAKIMKKVAEATWQASIELASEKGTFPFFQEDYLRGNFVLGLDEQIRRSLAQHGIRNSHHNTIAPTGTISLLANNVSNGIEPVFKADYDRHVRVQDEKTIVFHVKDYAFQLWQQKNKNGLPPEWVDTDSLTPEAHLQIQGAMQPFIDNAISKTINIPRDFPFEKMVDVYSKAYALGLKGCTVFRPNPVTGSVLEASKSDSVDHCCPFE